MVNIFFKYHDKAHEIIYRGSIYFKRLFFFVFKSSYTFISYIDLCLNKIYISFVCAVDLLNNFVHFYKILLYIILNKGNIINLKLQPLQ